MAKKTTPIQQETFNLVKFEQMHLTQQRQTLYTACEDLDFVWDEKDVLGIERLWNAGFSIHMISNQYKRDPDEVMILLIDRARQGFIKRRRGGIWGKYQAVALEVAEK